MIRLLVILLLCPLFFGNTRRCLFKKIPDSVRESGLQECTMQEMEDDPYLFQSECIFERICGTNRYCLFKKIPDNIRESGLQECTMQDIEKDADSFQSKCVFEGICGIKQNVSGQKPPTKIMN
jgi:hypothetical protein